MVTHIDAATPLDQETAEYLDKQIRALAESMRENIAKIEALVAEAKAGQIHLALGFKSWTAYIADALAGQLELTTDTRREVVALMAGEGMSQRAIAGAIGASKSSVQRDVAELQVVHCGPPETVTGLDGKLYPATHKYDEIGTAGGEFDDRRCTFQWGDGPVMPGVDIVALLSKVKGKFKVEEMLDNLNKSVTDRGNAVIGEMTEMVSLHASLRRAECALQAAVDKAAVAVAAIGSTEDREITRKQISKMRGYLDAIGDAIESTINQPIGGAA